MTQAEDVENMRTDHTERARPETRANATIELNAPLYSSSVMIVTPRLGGKTNHDAGLGTGGNLTTLLGPAGIY